MVFEVLLGAFLRHGEIMSVKVEATIPNLANSEVSIHPVNVLFYQSPDDDDEFNYNSGHKPLKDRSHNEEV